MRFGAAEQRRWLYTGSLAASAVRSALPANVPDFKTFLQTKLLAATPTLDARLAGERQVYIETYGACTG
jgi:hypothetical protein